MSQPNSLLEGRQQLGRRVELDQLAWSFALKQVRYKTALPLPGRGHEVASER